MCFSSEQLKNQKVYKVHNQDGEITKEHGNENNLGLPEHVDNAFLDTNIRNGILGFRYETKDGMFVVYSSVEKKTFCMIMQLTPLRK